MKSHATAFWFLLAAVLFSALWLDHHHRAGKVVEPALLPGFQADAVTKVEIIPAGSQAIQAGLNQGQWRLENPRVYPALNQAIGYLLKQLGAITPASHLGSGEMQDPGHMNATYGFDSPQFTIKLEAGSQQWRLIVGNRTAPGDQVFVQVEGQPGVFVTDASWLQALPTREEEWRDTSLLRDQADFDVLDITNGVKAMELKHDPESHMWRMTRPLEARADNEEITTALEKLRSTQVTSFVGDGSGADPSVYGLNPPSLSIRLFRGTEEPDGMDLGGAVPGTNGLVYVKRARYDQVATVPEAAFAMWRGAVNDFRDPYLMEITRPVNEIHVAGASPFTLQLAGSNTWRMAGQSLPVDPDTVGDFLKILAGLRIKAFVKDNNTATDLKGFGLDDDSATNQISIVCGGAGTNEDTTRIFFGQMESNAVYVRRSDETSVYSIALDDYNQARLYESPWFFRDRRIWDFSETNVDRITLEQNGKTRVLIRDGVNDWSLAPGSQGIINPPALEEVAHRLGKLKAWGWMGRNIPEKQGGFMPGNLKITVQLKDGTRDSVAFGAELPRANTALAAVQLDQDRWVFVFPPVVYQFVAAYLTIPPTGP